MSSNRTKLTKSKIEGMPSGSILWDSELPGFGARRQLGLPVYFLKTRIGSRQRWFTIGRHGAPWTVETAKDRARVYLGEIAKGRDPATERDLKSINPTVTKAVDLYLSGVVDGKLKPSTASQYRDILERICLPILGQIKVNEVHNRDVSNLHLKLKDKPVTANRAVAVLSSFFAWCERVGYRDRDTNPTTGIKRFRENPRERFLTPRELKRLGMALSRAERQNLETPWALAAIRLLLFTGMRRTEILTLKWDNVDTQRATLRLPETKTGPRSVYLSAPALEILSSVPRIAGNPYVIVGEVPGKHLVNISKVWKRICRIARIKGVRIHDLRHSFASVGASGGLSLHMIGKLLGHSRTETTHRYSHLSADPIRIANESVGREIAAMLEGNSASIAQLRRKAAG
jgi:integrase